MFRSTFIASSCKYMVNNECIKGEEVEYRYSLGLDPTPMICGFHKLINFINCSSNVIFSRRAQ